MPRLPLSLNITVTLFALGRVAAANPLCDQPTPEPLPVTSMALVPSAPMPQTALPPGRSIGLGAVVRPGVLSPDRIVVARGQGGALLDVRTGAVLASTPVPELVSPRAGVVTFKNDPSRLLRLADAKIVEPRLDADHPIIKRVLAASVARTDVLAMGEDADGMVFAGVANENVARIALRRVPFAPSKLGFSASGDAAGWLIDVVTDELGGSDTGVPAGLLHAEACRRARPLGSGLIECLAYAPRDEPTTLESLSWLANGWAIGRSLGMAPVWVLHASCGAKRIVIGDPTDCSAQATRIDPPSALVICDKSPKAYLWTPRRLFTFAYPANPPALTDDGPIVALHETKTSVATRFIDVVHPHAYDTPPLEALGIDPFDGGGVERGVEPRALAAHRSGKTSLEVYLLDFASATQSLVGTVDDCAGPLQELSERRDSNGRWLVLVCMENPPAGVIAREVKWSEIIDTKTRVRLRSRLLPEVIFDDGLAVLTNRKWNDKVGTLTVVDLLQQASGNR